MTGSSDGTTGTAALSGDSRARVPFAIVAVLLLVSAVALVGYLDTRGPAETDTDPALAMDRTDATVQTALRDATASAAQQAAAEPLTSLANTSYGDALDEERPFLSYLEALVYLEASERFETAGQHVGDVETSVSLPPVADAESFESAIDRVTISESNGLLAVELDGIEITATRDGQQLASRTETVEVSVPTPVVRQHERTQEFQQRLDAGVTSMGNFSQRFNARIYGLGWLRGYAQYGGMPVTEIIANRHVEPSANSALYRIQQATFGAADPNLKNAVRRGWFCMVAQDAEALYNGYGGGEFQFSDNICKASEWLFGEKHTGELPDAPETLDLLGSATGLNEEQTIGVNETAYSPLRTLVAGSDEHSIEQAIERVFTIDTGIDAEFNVTESPVFDHVPPHPNATWTVSQRSHDGISVDSGTATSGNPAENGTYYRFSDIETAIEITEERTWEWTENGSTETATTEATGTLDVAVTVRLVENATAPDMYVDTFNGNISIDHKYESGPTSPDDSRTVPAPGFQNYADRQAGVAEAVVGGTTTSAFGDWLGGQWGNVTSTGDLALPESREAVLGLDSLDEQQLVSTALEDIAALQPEVEGITHTFERTDLVRGEDETGPVGELLAAVEAEREAYLDREQPYESVGQQAVYEVRYAYFETLLEDLQRLEDAHGEVMGGLDSHLDGVDSSLDDALSFLQAGVSPGGGNDPDAPSLESPPVTPEITYEVSGSPTYLAGETVTTETVPAVEQGQEFSPFAAKTRNHLKLPYETIVSGIIGDLFGKLGLGDSDVELTLRTAGEALRAGELADDAAEASSEYGDDGTLADGTDELQDALEDALTGEKGFSVQMGVELVSELYGIAADYPDSEDDPYADNDTHSTAYETAESATAGAVEEYNTTAEAAIAIGGGNATEQLVTALQAALDDEDIGRPEYAQELSGTEWQAVVASAVRPALDRAAANATATLDDTDTVETLDTATRQALENVSVDIAKDRLDASLNSTSFNLSKYDDWVGNGSEVDTPVRVPAGLPLLPVPTHWVATMNIWDIDADGQYTRFEVAANMSAPGRATSTTYVRENITVDREIDGETRTLGAVEPITFDGRSVLVVVVPPGGIGVGDRDDVNPKCTPTYPVVGPFDAEDTACEFLEVDPPENGTAGP
jgi:hypothetical protein